ncbi:glycosyltransferase family 1 protein [Amylostereum chailletii]|nr:glycosyltransferase family 1 protein [Amylostereum chailletii]
MAFPLAPPTPKLDGETCSFSVFLGSGGHSSEALSLISALDFSRYTPRTYIVSAGDTLSIQKVTALELLKIHEDSTTDRRDTSAAHYRVLAVPRARRVHQTLLTSPFTALYSLLVSIYHFTVVPHIFRSRSSGDNPEVLFINGPGTCVVLCLAVCLNRVLGLPSPRIIYVESFARVKSLSVSGKLLRRVVDRFIVQWPDILSDGRRGDCRGWLV